MPFDATILAYLLPLLLIWSVYLGVRRFKEARSLSAMTEAIAAGLGEPASLHPKIDPSRCLGCGACVLACPEHAVLGLVRGKAELIEPAQCIGHGACKAACPHGAISLVFGTETRGVDIPNVDANFQTNVPGIFIAGELGGMGLIRNAIEQGRQALAAIAERCSTPVPGLLDVLIVGGGPAGISASLAAKQHRLNFVTVEQDSLGGTVAQFPRGKLVMTQPVALPLAGTMDFKEVDKERLLRFWKKVVAKTGLRINFRERVEAIEREAGAVFAVRTTRAIYRTRHVLLAIGRRGTPRKLSVPGEELPKVVYRLIDAEQYRGRHVLVVGGGDSALEAAASIAEVQGTTVTLSYRSAAFGRAKIKNRQRVEAVARAGRITVLLGSNVTHIGPSCVGIECAGRHAEIRNDAVIVCAGGILPTAFLKSMGVHVETKFGTA